MDITNQIDLWRIVIFKTKSILSAHYSKELHDSNGIKVAVGIISIKCRFGSSDNSHKFVHFEISILGGVGRILNNN